MRSSTGEVKIYEILTMAGLPFAEEYEFPDLVSSSGRHLRFDFAVFNDYGDVDFLIEFQGRQHYMPVKKFGGTKGLHRQQYNDILKRKYCLAKDIKLILIPYYDEGKVTYDYIMESAGLH